MGCEVYNIFFDFFGFCDFICAFFLRLFLADNVSNDFVGNFLSWCVVLGRVP